MGTSELARLIAIGDVHGCAKALDALIAEIQPSERDVIVFLGDYVDRGPDSRGVIDRIIELEKQTQVVSLLGNHEIMMLIALQDMQLQFWTECGGEQTLASYGGDLANVPEQHLTFLQNCRRYYETNNHFFVHANYDDQLPLDQQPDDLLFWTHITYHVPKKHISGKTAIVGHTPQGNGEILDLDHIIGVDTYCFGNGWLTALDVETGQVWQADKDGCLRSRNGSGD